MQLHWNAPNLAKNLARAGLGRISEKWPDSGFAGAEIRYNPSLWSDHNYNKTGAPQFADFEVAADEIAARNWPPCKRPTI